MRIRIFPRYIIRLLLPYLALAAGIFTAVLCMNQFARVLGEAIKIGAPLGWVFYAMSQLTPGMLALGAPMAYQLAVLLTLGLLSERGELLALRAAGFSFWQMAWPPGLVALALCGALLWLNNFASPACFRRFMDSRYALAGRISNLRVEPKTVVNVGQWRFYADTVEDDGALEQVMLFRYPQGAEGRENWTLRVSAPRGTFAIVPSQGLVLDLEDGEMQKVDPADPSRVIMARFGEYSVAIPLVSPGQGARDISLNELSTPEIIRGIKHAELTEQRRAEYKVEAATRLAVALSPLVFFWLSCPLGIGLASRSRAAAMVLSVGILFAFYGATASGISLGRKLHALSWWAPWLADALGLLAGFFFWRRAVRG
ncbi:MAG: LptF/LptG family permease [Elusimicrobiales bacterium]|nr:LptF/LptG family permease [Elusimicrobiales bacterium]